MRNNKGFVMIETIIVISVLAVGLISLYSSYSLILSKTTTKSSYDNAEYIYKTYFITKMISSDEDNIDYISLKTDNTVGETNYKEFYNNKLSNSGLHLKYNNLINTYNEKKINIKMLHNNDNSTDIPYKVLYDNTLKNGVLFAKYNALLNLYDVDKIYLTPMDLSIIIGSYLLEFDGSTIGYLKSIYDNEVLDNSYNRIIIKYKNGKGETEFSSLPITLTQIRAE